MNLDNGRMRPSGDSRIPKPLALDDPMKQAGDELAATLQMVEDAWKKAEAKLALSHVPVDVQVPFREESLECGGGFTEFLSYRKVKNQWRICWICSTEVSPDPDVDHEVECRPITDCPVGQRLEMFQHFEKLYNEVMKVTKDYVPKIKEAVQKFEATLEYIDL